MKLPEEPRRALLLMKCVAHSLSLLTLVLVLGTLTSSISWVSLDTSVQLAAYPNRCWNLKPQQLDDLRYSCLQSRHCRANEPLAKSVDLERCTSIKSSRRSYSMKAGIEEKNGKEGEREERERPVTELSCKATNDRLCCAGNLEKNLEYIAEWLCDPHTTHGTNSFVFSSSLINGNNHCERRLHSVPIDHGQSRLWSHNTINNNHHQRQHITPSSLDDHPSNGPGFGNPQLDNHVICEVNDNCYPPQPRESSSEHLEDQDAFSTSSFRNSPPQIDRPLPGSSYKSTRPSEKPSCLSKSKSESFSKPSPPQRQVKFLDDCQIETVTKAVPLPCRLKVKMDESTTTTSSSTNTITTQQQHHHHQSSHHVTIVDHRSGSNPQITIDEYAGEYPLHEDNAFRTKIDR